jgi:hypothetical protein
MYLSAANTLDFATNSTNRLSIASTGAATFSSGIGIGGATATTGGIQFPATQVAIADANNLDDYEEGTWTPAVTVNSGTATTYTDLAGTYTKIGNRVIISGSLRPTNGTFGAASSCTISGLPFNGVITAPRAGTVCAVNGSNYTTNEFAIGAIEGTSIQFAMSTAISSNNIFSFAGSYLA